MQVKILVAFADHNVGDIVHLDDAEASRLISGRWVIPAPAVAPPPATPKPKAGKAA